ncbi:MAG TPA: M20 family metallopeptidase [Solirubrobacteraceae bacterium]|nr:M20 family metallopeptidase [Solirubrobacteraceae bacterium]
MSGTASPERDLADVCARASSLPVSRELLESMLVLRRELHAAPELSNHEVATAARLQRALEQAGITEFRSAAGTGFVVDVVGAHEGPTIALRGDLDALPITEELDLPWASRHPGVMHACGHDAHASMLYAAALALHADREQLAGTVRCIFQPAEEAEPLGGRRIVEEGHLNGVVGAVGIHVDPTLPTGAIGVMPGVYSCASDEFDIEVHGVSAHAAKPHEGVDAIAIGAALVSELQLVAAREHDPAIPLVISVGSFHGGVAYNVLADHVTLGGTIRTADPELHAFACRRLRDIAEAIAERHGGSATVSIRHGEPPVVNDRAMVGLISDAARRLAGQSAVIPEPAWTASDDFGFYSEAAPSVYFRLGIRPRGSDSAFALHHPRFAVDEDALPLGTAILVEAAKSFLRPGGDPGRDRSEADDH